MSNALECSSKGDKRFSALVAKVKVFDVFDTIEAHYQGAKEYFDLQSGNLVKASNWQEAKEWQKQGMMPVRINVQGTILPYDFLTQYYKLLWVKYLDANPELVEYAKQFDEFTDMFRGKKTLNCQADVIKQYVKEGKESIMKECQPLLQAFRGVFVREVIGDLLEAKELVIGHQVNCLGIMGGGLAALIKKKYPVVFREYEMLCKIGQKTRSLMGHCQLVEIREEVVEEQGSLFVFEENEGKVVRIVANLFGQHEIGTDKKRTEEEFLKKALVSLKEKVMEKGYSVALPYQLGSGLAGGNWLEILEIVKEVFHDYPVTIYRLPNA